MTAQPDKFNVIIYSFMCPKPLLQLLASRYNLEE